MQAIKMEKPGSYDVLKVVDIDMPIAKTGELLIEVKATAVNRTDIVTRENKNLTAPYPILGVEIAGVVIENHSQDQRFQPGAKVCGLVNHGGYANYAVIPSERAMLIPENLYFEEAAGLPEVFLTAYQTLYWLGELKENETVLIHAGASGVGTAAIQLAKQLTNA
ncbi:MAG: alcohol dehydrogenase catalytic domain-containing protein, partial [Carnobacterium maltaromaticum]